MRRSFSKDDILREQMKDITEIEARLESIREVYVEICAEADEDNFRDEGELAMIARVDKKIKQLEAELRVARAKAKKEHDPRAAWEEVSILHKDLLRLQADMKKAAAKPPPPAQDSLMETVQPPSTVKSPSIKTQHALI